MSLTFGNPELKIRVSLAEISRLIKQAHSLVDMSENPRDNKHFKFLGTLTHFIDKDRGKLFISEAQLKYLCDLAGVDPKRYIFIDIN